MKRKCVDSECNKKFVVSKALRKQMKEAAPYFGAENLCHTCFKDVCQNAHEQTYFGSIKEWGA